MKKILLFVLWGVVCTNGIYAHSKVQQSVVETRDNKVYILANEREYEALSIISVKFHNLHELQKKYNVIRHNKLSYADIKCPSELNLIDFVNLLEKDDNVLYIDYNCEGEYTSMIPNDTYWGDMWHLSAINIPAAWDITTGNPQVKVGILDTGVDWEHPELGYGNDSYQNIYCKTVEDDWSNPNNPTTGNNIDDDANGLVDDYKGWNFANNSNDSRGTMSHGTFVAGIVGAKTNNGCGISGVAGGNNASGVSLISYCIGSENPNTSIVDDAIITAVNDGVRIINISAVFAYNSSINSALQYAKDNNVTVVCAAGNNGFQELPFPANDSNVIAVGALDEDFNRAYFSNFGSNLSVMAPGVNIRGLNLTSEYPIYKYDDGTSFAAPQVAGVAALMLSVNPFLQANEIQEIIETTAVKLEDYSFNALYGNPNATWNFFVGYGMVNAYAAVSEARDRAVYMQGTSTLCNTNSYQLINLPSTANVSWSYETDIQQIGNYPVLQLSNTTSSTITVQRGSFLSHGLTTLYSGYVTLKATVTHEGLSRTFSKTILL
ncbi:MAG: S8 family serine peptidase [Paludibacteraceae bacterium]|nr:S8 family serine peptidase [Paludibacteraceae bacterium]